MTIYRMVYTLGVTDPQEQFNKMIQYLEEGQHIYIQDIDPLTPEYEIPEVLPEDYKQALYDHFTSKNRKMLIDHWNGITKWDYFYLKPEPPKPKFEYPPEFIDTEAKEETPEDEEKKKSVLSVIFAPTGKKESNTKKDKKAQKEDKKKAKEAKKAKKEQTELPPEPPKAEPVPFPLPKIEEEPVEEIEYIPPVKQEEPKKKKGGRPKKVQPPVEEEEPVEEEYEPPKKKREVDPQVLAFREKRKQIEETTRKIVEEQQRDEERERKRKLKEQQTFDEDEEE